MIDDEERRRYGDTNILEPIVEHQDDEISQSPMSNSSTHRHFLDEEQRAREEIENFEALEKEFASNRHGIRVKFAYSLDDDDRLLPMTQTTVVKTEPYFHIKSSEDQVTKHFYENPFQSSEQFLDKSSPKSPSEPDSLEEEYHLKMKKKDRMETEETTNGSDRMCSSLSSPGKSILRKSSKKLERSSTSRSRSPSPCSSSKKKTTFVPSNEFSYLAEITGKQTSSLKALPIRSLFEPTVNIFDSSSSLTNVQRRPSRLRYYIKPYRGEANLPSEPNNNNKQRSRSLSEQRLAGTTSRWLTFVNPSARPSVEQSIRKQNVSWSPVREYIHQGRDKNSRPATKKKEPLVKKTSTHLSTQSSLSSSSPCLPSTSSQIPVSLRHRSTNSPSVPQHFRQSFPPSSIENCSVSDRPLTPIIPLSQFTRNEDKPDRSAIRPLPDLIDQHKKEHDQTMQRYDRLLEKMKTTDKQLQTLSRSWTNIPSTKSSMKSNLSLKETTPNEQFISPIILQMCLVILVIFNLFVVYFFNEIHFWWSKYVGHTVIVEQRHGQSPTFS